jgi:hypothetical protein
MPIAKLFLTDAIKALPFQPKVQYSLWLADVKTLPGHVQGHWGPWVDLPRPHTISKPTGDTQRVGPGGNNYILALSVYCAIGLPVEMVGPPARTARIRYDGDSYVYRVMEIRTWGDVSDHAEIHCRRSLGESDTQA